MSKKTGRFSFMGTGIIGLLVIVLLGGGAVAFYTLRNQNNPIFNVEGSTAYAEGGEGGSSSVTVQSQNPEASVISSSPTLTTSSGTETVNQIDTEAEGTSWTVRYPIYQVVDGTCSLVGASSVALTQSRGGGLGYTGYLSGYTGRGIQGTITRSGRINLSLGAGNFIVTMDGNDIQFSSAETVITGKASTPNCPDSTFEVIKSN